jgi:diaminopimelate decarboxylase/aspartate kinase
VSRPWVVLKFGGTSVASAERWERIARRVRDLVPTRRVCVVVSAVAGVSNALEAAIAEALAGGRPAALDAVRDTHRRLADEIGLSDGEYAPVAAALDDVASRLDGIRLTSEASPRLVARIMAVGEIASTRIGVGALARHGVDARWVDARDLLVTTEGEHDTDHEHYLDARVEPAERPEALDSAAGGAGVVLTQGFMARDDDGDTCLLGRGGSDTSAALVAALARASELEIWSDVPGMFTADPHLVPVARLIRRIGYREAQEIAAMGAKVLHPRCLEPVARSGIPVSLRSTLDPDQSGTRIEATGEDHPAVTAVTSRTGVTLLTLSTLAMWRTSGFLARAFAPFEEAGISIDLIATSQSAVSVTLDKVPGGIRGPAFERLVERLERIGRVQVVHPCGVVSVVGRRIRAVLPELGSVLDVFHERPVHLVSNSSEDLDLSFVVDEEHTRSLVTRLHERLFSVQSGDPRFGPTWEVLGGKHASEPGAERWWRPRASELVALVADGRARYVYHLPTVTAQARRLGECLPSVDRFYYSMKANAHPRVLRALAGCGFGIECVSAAEVATAREVLGPGAPLLFTPNFCPMDEYRHARDAGAEITIDGPEPLEREPETFDSARIGLRIDPGRGMGHHSKVWTAGARAKFGVPRDDVERVLAAAARAGARIVGLHAHVGSGIFDPAAWAETAAAMDPLVRRISGLAWVDLGGGLGVAERPGQPSLDLGRVEDALVPFRRSHPGLELRLEPGRFLVAEAGVLVSPVTQVRTKGSVRFVGLATGMNSFLRPALYGAWHAIHNLSRLDEPPDGYWNVVGPICETSDVLGTDRLLPATEPGDVLLIDHAGAYGAVMASRYNLREPAEEVVLER